MGEAEARAAHDRATEVNDEPDHRAVMAPAVLNAIIDSSKVEDGIVTINSRDAQQALVTALATILEADTRLITPEQIREVAKTFVCEVLIQMEAMHAVRRLKRRCCA